MGTQFTGEDQHGDDSVVGSRPGPASPTSLTGTPGSRRPEATAPQTGDEPIDAALQDLARAQAGSLTERIDAGERTQAALRSRLSDLGGT